MCVFSLSVRSSSQAALTLSGTDSSKTKEFSVCAGSKPQVCVCVHTLVPPCMCVCVLVRVGFRCGGHASVFVYTCLCVYVGPCSMACDWLSGVSGCVCVCVCVYLSACVFELTFLNT